ncbi:MAG: protein kinase [Planctomycetaceae bacterium]
MSDHEATFVPHAVPTSTGSHPAVLGDYRLLEKLGQGGMGAVYRAEHVRLGKRVAIKLLPPETMNDSRAVARFQREMKAVGKLQHRNIVQALDAREEDGHHFLVMELVEGIELDDLRKILGPIRLPDAAAMMAQAALGLQHAHNQGLVHRDIKPSNLLLSHDGVVRILDLGLALLSEADRALSLDLTSTGQIMGTLDYMAPEQADDTHKVDIRADIYSLGCTFYALLAGHPPFGGEKYTTPIRKITAHMTSPVPSISKRRHDIPPEAEAVLNRMLAKKPEDRFQTPRDVAKALQPLAQKCNLPKLAARATAAASTAAPSDVSVQETIPQASAGPVTATKIAVAPATEPCAAPKPDIVLAAETIEVKPQPVVRSRRRQQMPWALIGLGTAIIAILLAVIIIKVKDKDGNVVATIKVPDGGSFEAVDQSSHHAPRDEPQGADSRTAGNGHPEMRPSQSEISNLQSEIPEPPPLEEWLKGRTILTVAQDGSGQFKTIQAALDALQPGQVVEVLDKGPYRELLRIPSRKRATDIGLVSRVGTTLGSADMVLKDADRLVFVANANAVRIEGFDIVGAVNHQGSALVMVGDSKRVHVQNCLFRHIIPAPSEPSGHGVIFFNADEDQSDSTDEGMHQLRNCWCECSVNASNAAVLIVENVFRRTWPSHVDGHQVSMSGTDTRVQLVRNIMDCASSHAVNLHGLKEPVRIEIRNNTLYGARYSSVVQRFTASRGVRIVGNIMQRFQVTLEKPANLEWDIRWNCVAPDNLDLDSIDFLSFPTATNYGVHVRPLTDNPSDRNYMRIPVGVVPTPTGDGPEIPAYIGALPPGPAPPDGDWLTRLQDRWMNSFAHSESEIADLQSEIPEPPPLEEWLKGRTILTVAQDGSGQFKTIQAALDALQRGQVVEVLDKGPYVQSLVAENLPEDVGLISHVDAVVVPTKWRVMSSADDKAAHILTCNGGLRVSGLVFDSTNTNETILVHCTARGAVWERCVFPSPGKDENRVRSLCLGNFEQTFGDPSTVQRCVFAGRLQTSFRHSDGKIAVRRNLFRSPFRSYPIHVPVMYSGDNDHTLLIEENVFATPQFGTVLAANHFGDFNLNIFYRRNTVLSSSFGLKFGGGCPKKLEVKSNIFDVSTSVDVSIVEADHVRANRGQWKFANNWYRIGPSEHGILPTDQDAFVGEIPFISKDVNHPGLARLISNARSTDSHEISDRQMMAGALPAGPAPPEGDWLTRLQARWQNAFAESKSEISNLESEIPEPPPLEEWLNGRTILTVAQDGSGQFDTIQAALDALQPGQVVEVLDEGPYVETLTCVNKSDVGLISRTGTVIRIEEWKESPHSPGRLGLHFGNCRS